MKDIDPFFLRALSRREQPQDASSLAEAVLKAIQVGMLPEGYRLPTIDSVSRALNLSPSSISRAWSTLISAGVLSTRRRGGTRVVRPASPTAFRHRDHYPGNFEHYLAAGYPDPDLLIDLSPHLLRVAHRTDFDGYVGKDHISGVLLDALMDLNNHQSESIVLSTDVMAALSNTLSVVSPRGSTVSMSDPEFPLYWKVADGLGLKTAPISVDGDGYSLDDIQRHLKLGISVIVLQAPVHSPSGIHISSSNVRAVADLVKTHDALVIEIDHHHTLAPPESTRIANFAPSNTVLISSFGKSFHPDIRVSPILGPESILHRIMVKRVGGAWVSAVNRHLLEEVFICVDSNSKVTQARREYDRRRSVFLKAFEGRGLYFESSTGLSLWLPVRDEDDTTLRLQENSVLVAKGSEYKTVQSSQAHVHLSLGLIGPHSEWLAQLCSEAAV